MSKVTRWWQCMLLGLLAGLGGCAGLRGASPRIVAMRDAHHPAVRNEMVAGLTSDCQNLPPPVDGPETAEQRRNRRVAASVFAVDSAYGDYERTLLNSVREDDLGAALAMLDLPTRGGVAGNRDLARGAATTNAIVTGTHAQIDRDYLLNQTLNVLQTQMRANRALRYALIVRRLALPYADWDSCMALSDVLALEQAGTLNGALAALAASADDAYRQGRAQVQGFTSPQGLALALRNYLLPEDGTARAARLEAARSIVDEEGLLASPPLSPAERVNRIVFEEGREAERLMLARHLVRSDPAQSAELAAAIPQ